MSHLMQNIDADYHKSVLPVEEFSPAMASMIHTKLEQSEWVFCMGDRLTEVGHKSLKTTLLGAPVSLPLGPFLLGYLNDVNIYSFHCYKKNNKFHFDLDELVSDKEKSRKNRESILSEYAEKYMEHLEALIIKDPTQWFNFYHYWKMNEE